MMVKAAIGGEYFPEKSHGHVAQASLITFFMNQQKPPRKSTDGHPRHRPSRERPVSRQIAFDILDQVLRGQRPLDEVMDRHDALHALSGRDRALVRQLLGTTLRRLGQIDALIESFLSKPARKPDDIRLRHILRLGAAQLLFLNIPDHAAVDTAVRLCHEVGLGHVKGVVNAVLRRVATLGPDMLTQQDAVQHNTPQWLWQSWHDGYGPDMCRAIASGHSLEPALDLSLRDPSQIGLWAEKLDAIVLPTGSLRRAGGGLVPELPGFDSGDWWVQDAAAALPARLLGDVCGKKIADLCAAPGGKTAQLAAAGAQVVAVDRSEKRLDRLRQNLDRLTLSAHVLAVDLQGNVDALLAEGPFDAILLDAPCSATGTIRRHPDVAWLKKPEDVVKLAAIQGELLNRACDWLKPGGVLVYCTCSLEAAEGENQIAQLLAQRNDMCRIPVTEDEIPGIGGLVNAAGDIRCTPAAWAEFGGLDGFFAARLGRKH